MKPASRNCRTTLTEKALPVRLYLSGVCHIKEAKSQEEKKRKGTLIWTDLLTEQLAVAPHRNYHDLSWGQPQWPGGGGRQKEGDDGLGY